MDHRADDAPTTARRLNPPAPVGQIPPPDALRVIYTAVEHTTDAVLITTASLDPPGPQIVYANPAFTRMTGYAAAEILGQTPRILQGPASDRAVLDQVRHTLARGESFQGEIVNYRKDGTPYLLAWSMDPVFDAQGTITHWVAIQRDITAAQAAQHERAQLLEAMQTALRLRNDMLQAVAHELRTPLTTIFGFAQLLHNKVRQATTVDQGQIVRLVDPLVRQAQRLKDLIDELLDVERLHAVPPTLAWTLVDLSALATEVVAEFQALRAAPTLLTLDRSPAPLLVLGDELRLRYVLEQLLHNAMVYSPAERPIRIVLAAEDQAVRISVEDEGIGIPHTALAAVWTRFYRAPNVNPVQINGFGIGLYVVQQIVTQHGGTVAVESTEGVGSTFTIRLPRQQPRTNP
jgi:PAS domain S-box-containing protein